RSTSKRPISLSTSLRESLQWQGRKGVLHLSSTRPSSDILLLTLGLSRLLLKRSSIRNKRWHTSPLLCMDRLCQGRQDRLLGLSFDHC
ncbi:hypothetical protein GBAR_LOCUS7275, partial [Geodia barretti]